MASAKLLLLVAVIVGVVVVAGALYARSASSSSGGSVEVDIEIVGGLGASTTDTYQPDNFTVSQGQTVVLVVQNTDDNPHGLAIPAFNVDTGAIKSGGTVRVTFVADKAGTFTFSEPAGYCGANCNSAQKMTGTMTVKP